MSVLANVAVPLFFPQPFLLLCALLPVVGIEGLVMKKQAIKVRLRDVFVANLFSTILGLPLAFFCSAILFEDFQLAVDKNLATLKDIFFVLGGLLLPCFALSVYLEGSYLKRRLLEKNGSSFWSAVIGAHCYSYLVLLTFYCAWIAFNIS